MTLIAVPLAILWPAAILSAGLDGRRRGPGVLAVGVLAAVFGVLAVLLWHVATDGPQELVVGGWPADVGIRLRVDALGASFALLSCGVLLASLLQAVVTGVRSRAVPTLTLFMALGLTGLFLTGDVFSFYVFFELAMIAAYALTARDGSGARTGAALIFAVVNLVGSFLFLIAIGALYRATGTLEMQAVAAQAAPLDPNTAILIAVTFFVAFGIKLGLFPFHFWLPSVYLAVSPHVAAMFAGALANIGAYGLLRFGGAILPREVAYSGAALIVIGSVSIGYGALQAIARRDTREVLAYSSIGHAGYVLVALGLGGPLGLAAAVIFSIANALSKTLLFLASELRGRLMATVFLVGVLSVAGVPPTAGFFGKAALFEAGIDARSVGAVILLFVGGALSFVYLFQIYQHDRWRPRAEREREMPSEPARLGQRAVVSVVAVLVLGLGLWPEPLLAIGDQVAEDLSAPSVVPR
ncbi:MAG TPA: proton-conducting transporter membrane subunit [Solirubrobacteraceae bacterium]|nr:proton-conducting transporter membrane subunit [Solirubrobacteraceae bacterium]